MSNVPWSAVVILGLALVVILVLVVLGRGGKLRTFNLKMLKGLFDFNGTLDTRDTANAGGSSSAPRAEGPISLAESILAWLGESGPFPIQGKHILAENTLENGKIAARLFSRVSGTVIATCFFESPYYGNGDFASTISAGTRFFRLTTSDRCDESVRVPLVALLGHFSCEASLAIVPAGVEISRIGGVFCELSDGSHIAFIALNNVGDAARNQGVVFSGTLARRLYQYYSAFAQRYQWKEPVVTDR